MRVRGKSRTCIATLSQADGTGRHRRFARSLIPSVLRIETTYPTSELHEGVPSLSSAESDLVLSLHSNNTSWVYTSYSHTLLTLAPVRRAAMLAHTLADDCLAATSRSITKSEGTE